MKGQVSEKGSGKETAEQADSAASGSTDHMTIYILLLVILGILAGLFIFRNVFTDYEQFERIASLAIRTELCILLAFVGLELGIQGDLLDNFRAVGLRVLAIPFAVIAGTLAASALVGIFLPIGVKNSLAVSTGLGWYSLAAGMLMDAGLMEAGAISFMHNVMRELLAIVLLPLVAKKIGYVEAVSLPGASAMDVCLPIVVRATSANTAVYSFISGLITGLAVPVLVPLFC